MSAITVDNVSGSTPAESASLASWSHTVGTNSSRMAVVTVSGRHTGTPPVVSTVTVGGVSGVTANCRKVQTEAWPEIWYVKNPPTGSQTVVVTLASASRGWGAGCVDLYNAKQSSPVNITGTGGNSSGVPSTAVTTTKDSCIVIDAFASLHSSEFTVGTSQTQIYQGVQYNDRHGSSYEVASSAGSATMSWTGSSNDWAQSVAAFETGVLGGAFLLNFI